MLSLRRAVSPLALASIGMLSTGAQAQTVGWTFTTNLTIDSASGHRSSMAMRTQATADRLRLEFVQVSGQGEAGQAEGMYMILSPRDSTMTMVMPSQRMATVNGTSELFGMAKPMMPAFQHHVTRQSLVDMGPGERLLGHATHRYRVKSTETSSITVDGQTCMRSSDADSEMWIAPDIDLQPAMQAVASHYGSLGIATVAVDAAGDGPALPKGTPLRTIVTSTTHPRAGAPVTTTTKIEIVELSHRAIDDALFTIPADYKTLDTRALMASVPPGVMDSIMRTQGPELTRKLCDSQ